MKNKIFNTLGHKLQWIFLLIALLGVSLETWGKYEFTDIYIYDPSKHWLNTSACIKALTYENSNCTDNLIETITFSEVSGCGALYKATRTNTAKNVNGIKIERYAGDCTTFWDGSISISSFDDSYYTYQLSSYSAGSWVKLYPSCLVGNSFSASLPSWNARNDNLTTSETRVKGTVLYKLKLQRNSTDPKFKFTNGRGWNGDGGVEFNTAGSVSVNSAVDLNVNRANGDMSLSRSTDGWYYTFYVLGQTPSKLSVLETAEDVRTITSCSNSQNPTAGQDVTITATLSGSVTTTTGNGAQYAYILYIDGNNSVLYSMTISSSTATGTIPAAKNTAGTTVKYKIITSPLNNLTYSNANFDYLYLTASSEYSYEVPACSYPSNLTNVYANGESSLTVCSGNDVVITATGAESGYDYILGEETKTSNQGNLTYTKLNPTTSTTYTIYAKQTGSSCATQSKGSVSVTVNSAPTVSAITTSGYVCEGVRKNLSVTASNATGYQWYLGDSPISGANSNSYSISSMSATGTYKCVVSNDYGCGTTTSGTTTQTLAPKPHNAVIADAAATCKGNTNAQYTASVDNDYTNASTLSWTWAVVSGSGWNVTSSNTNPGVFTAGSENGRIRATPTLTTGGQACAGTAAEKDVAVANKSITIKVEDAGQISSAPYIYAWYGSDSKIVGNWPGTLMIADAYNSGWYTYTLDVPSCSCNVVINMNSDDYKTNNLTSITADECYRITEWKRDKANYLVDCPIPCTAPTAYTVGGGGTICKYASKAITLADSQVGYTYELYKDNVATDIKAAGTGEALEIATGGIGANGTYAYTIKAFDTASSGCLTAMSGSASVVVSSSEAEEISPTYATVNNMEAVTLTSSGSVNWSITNMVGDDSYLYETTDTSTKFKGTVGSSTTGKYFHVQGKIGADGCINTAVIYVSRDEEDCN